MSPLDIERALRGDAAAKNELALHLEPAIVAEVGRALRPAAAPEGHNWRQQVMDLVQEVYIALFANDGQLLRRWDPSRGMSLRSFAGLVAFRHVLSALRTKRRNPYEARATEGAALDEQRGRAPDAEHHAASREQLAAVLSALHEQFSERDELLFRMLVVDEVDTDTVCAVADMTRGAVYAWRARLNKRIEKIRATFKKSPAE